MNELIFLIGYRGTGKTTVAPILGERLRWKWVDADAVLEERQGRSIASIFEVEGEAGFRAKEELLMEELCRLRQHVVAAGGGVILRATNRERLRSAGLVVWLKADAEIIRSRIEQDATTQARRPVLTAGGLAEVKELLRVREPLYRACADCIVETTNRSPEEVADQIWSLVVASKLMTEME